MRLIDADTLKETLSSKDLITWTYEYGDAIPCDWLMSTIDNAPTVDISETISKFRNTAYQNGVTTGLNKRSRGEWIDDDNDLLNFKKCSNCGECAEWLDGGSQLLSNFCPNCGAALRGYDKEE